MIKIPPKAIPAVLFAVPEPQTDDGAARQNQDVHAAFNKIVGAPEKLDPWLEGVDMCLCRAMEDLVGAD